MARTEDLLRNLEPSNGYSIHSSVSPNLPCPVLDPYLRIGSSVGRGVIRIEFRGFVVACLAHSSGYPEIGGTRI